MKENLSESMVEEIMTEFASMTGLSPGGKFTPRRYLWTDAFAVCNFLGLYSQSRDEKFKVLALKLVDQVHNILGQHRDDDQRTGWISGLDDHEGVKHPTKGGLRIGKEMNERAAGDPLDEQMEWDRDGQYFHYLTKWMHALNRITRTTGDSTYNKWAIELAGTAHAGFTYLPPSGGQKRMYWKMSIDLSYPLVPSMGHHDPLDGFITYNQLQATADRDPERSALEDLKTEIADMDGICAEKTWATTDPLGLGGLLCDAFKIAQLIAEEDIDQTDLLENLLASSLVSLELYTDYNQFKLPADYRLAFRELGLSIGLRSVEKLQLSIDGNPSFDNKRKSLELNIQRLMRYLPLGEMIEAFWLEGANRETRSWMAHRDINMVMLATSLAPDGYLFL